jgi:ABC-type branched-subunit amino acid transport system substrate-binding protein
MEQGHIGSKEGRRERPAGRPSTRGRRRSLLAPAVMGVTLLLLAGACSSSRSNDAGGSTTTVKGKAAADSFGTLDTPCGSGDAKGATAQGVTDSSITIGYGDDAGYQPAPGLSHQMSDGMKAMIAWCNNQGGINGRKVVGDYFDAKVTEVNNAMTDACGKVFMLVGEGWVFDSGQETLRQGCNLPAVPGFAVSPQFANAPIMYQPVPNPADYVNVEIAAAFQKMFPDEIKKSAVVFADYAPTRDTMEKAVQSFPSFGFQFLDCPQVYGIAGESDWKPFAQSLKNCGAQVVYFVGSPYPNFENFLDAANQVDYHPIYITDANMYDQTFAAWNTNGYADKVYSRQTFLPLEEADQAPAIQQYIDAIKATGGEINQLGEQSTSAFLLWATAAKACGSDLTRTCVLDKLSKVDTWTAGGLHASGNPSTNMPTDCGLVLKLDGTKFVRAYPDGAGNFDCSPSYVAKLSGHVVDQAHLDANRVAQLQ